MIYLEKNWEIFNTTKGSYIRSKLLFEKGFSNGFFTRTYSDNSPKYLIKELDSTASIHVVKQVHGGRVTKACSTSLNNKEEADGIVSSQSLQSLWVYSADCIPVLIANPKNGQVSACHAGWRGIKEKVLINAISKLTINKGNINELLIAFGPSISQDRYQVGEEILNSIYDEVIQSKANTKEISEAQLDKLISLKIVKLCSNKYYLDITQAAKIQLLNAGISSSNLLDCRSCTYSNPELFFSRRRENNNKVQWSVIISPFLDNR